MEEWHSDRHGVMESIRNGYVTIGAPDLKSSSDAISGPDFFNCHYLGFIDKDLRKGTAGHLVSYIGPSTLLDGWAGNGSNGHSVVPINELYENPDDVSVIHVYHSVMNLMRIPVFREESISETLLERGFRNVRHVQLYEERGHEIFRDIMLDTKKGCVYVLPKEERGYMRIPFF